MRKILLSAIMLLGLLITGSSFAITVTPLGSFGTSVNINGQIVDVRQLVMDYTAQYTQVIDPAFSAMSDSYAISNSNQPIFGKPNHWLAVGFNTGVGFSSMKFDENKAGGKELNSANIDAPVFGNINPLTLGVVVAPYASISLGWMSALLGIEFFEKTDITLKYLSFNSKDITGDDYNAKMSNFGLTFRKQFFEDTTLIPLLLSFSGLSWNIGFNTSSVDGHVNVPVSSDNDVNMGAYNATYDKIVKFSTNDAIIDYHVKTFSLDTELKGYVNILYFLDLYFGAGVTWNLQNKVDIDGTITGSLAPGLKDTTTGAKYYDTTVPGGLRIDGEGQGQKLIPRIMMGSQINIAFIKIGAQYSVAYTKDANIKNITFGAGIEF